MTDMNGSTPDEREGKKESGGRLIDEFLVETLAGTLADLSEQARRTRDDAIVERTYGRVKQLRQLRHALSTLVQRGADENPPPVYLVSAAFLAEAFATLTKTKDEDLVYATGPEDGTKLFALTRIVAFDLASKGVAHATPEPKSQTEALLELDERGERLLATMHSHPDRGAGATKPSSLDLATQAGLERMGYPAIGAIFCRSGHVRFFSANRAFRVVVSGAGCEQLEERVFHLADIAPKSFLQAKGGEPWFPTVKRRERLAAARTTRCRSFSSAVRHSPTKVLASGEWRTVRTACLGFPKRCCLASLSFLSARVRLAARSLKALSARASAHSRSSTSTRSS